MERALKFARREPATTLEEEAYEIIGVPRRILARSRVVTYLANARASKSPQISCAK